MQAIKAPNGIDIKYVGSSSGQSETEDVPVTENQVDVLSDGTKNGSNPTLDRINL